MSIYDKASLVLIPSGTKTSKVYSQKPVSGDGDFTFSRSTAATRVNADGNIEKETQNLLLQSNSFDTTWVKSSVSVTGGQTGYDGSSDAWLFDSTSGYIYQSISASGVHTLSLYVKAGTALGFRLRVDQAADANYIIDLSDGSLVSEGGNISYKSTSVGGGWFRMEMAFVADTITNIQFRVTDLAGTTSSGTAYIQDAQLNQGLIAQEVITTTTTAIYGGITDNVPRLDYTDSSCPALLLEPQRTNTFLTSEWFGIWDLNAGTTLTYNYAISPEGVQNATRYVGTGASGFGDKFTLTNGTRYTISAYVKSNTGATQFCRLIGDSSNISSDLEVTAEWTRIDYTWTSAGLTSKTNGIFRDSSNNDIDILVYGLQLEAGSYATSYIPTYGSAVTRNQDNTLNSSAASVIGQTEGAIYAEVDFKAISEESRFVQLSDGTNNNRFLVGSTSSNGVQIYVVSGGAVQWTPATTAFSDGVIKVAVAYKNNDYAMYVNGTQINTSSSASVPAMDEISIGYNSIVGNRPTAYGHRKVMLFPTRLTNAELADLTTL